MSRYWSPVINQLSPYVPGEQPKLHDLVKLNTNENPYGPSARVIEAIRNELGDGLRLYPDPTASRLRQTVAAYYGLPYAFASHFAPAELSNASRIYRRKFKPSKHLDKPHFMMAINVFAAATDAEGAYLRTSMQQAFINLRTGRPGPLPAPVADLEALVGPVAIEMVEDALRISAVGAPETVKATI